MTFQSVHWTVLLSLPTEAPALIKVLKEMTVDQINEAVENDLAVCAQIDPNDSRYAEAQWIMGHIIALSNEELENRA